MSDLEKTNNDDSPELSGHTGIESINRQSTDIEMTKGAVVEKTSKFKKIIIPLVIILIGFVGMKYLTSLKTPPSKIVKVDKGVLVESLIVKKDDYTIMINGTGTVKAKQESTITLQVGGKVVYVSKNFAAGGFFKKDEVMFKIEALDYELAIDKAGAELARAEFDLATAESQASVAKVEWDNINPNSKEKPNPLVLHIPQLKKAKAVAASARASLKQAEINLERTIVKAPFNSMISKETIDLGKYIIKGMEAGMLLGTDEAEIIVPLTMEDMLWLKIPRGTHKGETGAKATVKMVRAYSSVTWEGEVVRALGEVDKAGRMSRVVVSVKDPYNFKERNKNKGLELQTGMFVQVSLTGKEIQDVMKIPNEALRDDSTVWVSLDNKLYIKPVTIDRREKESVYISSGLVDGEQLILTAVQGAANTMKLRTITLNPESKDEGDNDDDEIDIITEEDLN